MKPISLPKDRMPEAEVSLRLAFHLLTLPGCEGAAEVAIDGAQVKVDKHQVFPIVTFLSGMGWEQVEQIGGKDWQGRYVKDGQTLIIHSTPGVGDVVVRVGAKRIRAECKGGPLIKRRGSSEYPKPRGALGQIITAERVEPKDVLVVAVPQSPKFRELAGKWRDASLVQRTEIRIALVGRDGMVEGLELR